ncbi:hypothetical protein QJS10_CPA03g02559 [Acorus calamus]|uniref:Ferrochelatase n=1 Tax=Acorus calamus TaxID=4465 RepID=A0AAV9F994_ACOCL|nr:hypothetical protein QJS10_CPA03g02559 [Acorus calamus]
MDPRSTAVHVRAAPASRSFAARERLSSSHQASTQGVSEMGSIDVRSSTVTQKISSPARFPARPACTTLCFHRSIGLQTEACVKSCVSKKSSVSKYPSECVEPITSFRRRPFKWHCSSSRAVMTSKSEEVSNSVLVGNEKVGVLLLNLGGPETLDDVQPFLFNLFADPDIIRLPRLFRFLQKPLAQFISVVRAPKSKEGYASIGGGSPLRRITDQQACVYLH